VDQSSAFVAGRGLAATVSVHLPARREALMDPVDAIDDA
jgi:hypothetical protein